MNTDALAMTIIGYAGQSQSLIQEAAMEARKQNTERALELLNQAEESVLEAHKVHTELLAHTAADAIMPNFLMVHASNHLSQAQSMLFTARLFVESR